MERTTKRNLLLFANLLLLGSFFLAAYDAYKNVYLCEVNSKYNIKGEDKIRHEGIIICAFHSKNCFNCGLNLDDDSNSSRQSYQRCFFNTIKTGMYEFCLKKENFVEILSHREILAIGSILTGAIFLYIIGNVLIIRKTMNNDKLKL